MGFIEGSGPRPYPDGNERPRIRAWAQPRASPAWLGLLTMLAAVAAGTLLVFPLKSAAPVVSLGVVYLPAIMVISIVWGLRLGLLSLVRQGGRLQLLPDAAGASLHHRRRAELGRADRLRDRRAGSSAVARLARAQAMEAERRREEADRALAELAALSRERDRMQEEMVEAEALRRSDELKTALLRSISHDLRTPLTSMIASGAALGSATPTAEERPS